MTEPVPDGSHSDPVAGWYPNPADTGTERYWDGGTWTAQTRPRTALPPVEAPVIPAAPASATSPVPPPPSEPVSKPYVYDKNSPATKEWARKSRNKALIIVGVTLGSIACVIGYFVYQTNQTMKNYDEVRAVGNTIEKYFISVAEKIPQDPDVLNFTEPKNYPTDDEITAALAPLVPEGAQLQVCFTEDRHEVWFHVWIGDNVYLQYGSVGYTGMYRDKKPKLPYERGCLDSIYPLEGPYIAR